MSKTFFQKLAEAKSKKVVENCDITPKSTKKKSDAKKSK